MQMAQGAPGDMVPVVAVGLLPMAGRALGSTGTSMANWRTNFPSVSKTWMRRVARSGKVKLLGAFDAVPCAGVEMPGRGAGVPPGLGHAAALSDFSGPEMTG